MHYISSSACRSFVMSVALLFYLWINFYSVEKVLTTSILTLLHIMSITVVHCQPPYERMAVFWIFVDFFQANNVLGSFFELYTIKEPKNMCCIAK